MNKQCRSVKRQKNERSTRKIYDEGNEKSTCVNVKCKEMGETRVNEKKVQNSRRESRTNKETGSNRLKKNEGCIPYLLYIHFMHLVSKIPIFHHSYM